MVYLVRADFEWVDESDEWANWFSDKCLDLRETVDTREAAIELGNKWFEEHHGKHISVDIHSAPDDYETRSSYTIEDWPHADYKVVLETSRWDAEKGKAIVETVYVDENRLCTFDAEDYEYEELVEMELSPAYGGEVYHMMPKTMFKKCLGKEKAEQYFTEDTILVATIYGSFEGHEPIELDSYAMKGNSKRKYLKGYRKDFIS